MELNKDILNGANKDIKNTRLTREKQQLIVRKLVRNRQFTDERNKQKSLSLLILGKLFSDFKSKK